MLTLDRGQILAHRMRTGMLDRRYPHRRDHLERAARVGLQDSMPRAALLSLHARIEGVGPMGWEDPAYVQLWGPRFSTYVVAARDVGIFTLGRLSDDPRAVTKAYDLAKRFRETFGDEKVSEHDIGRALGIHPTQIRYAAPTGTLLIRWEGARSPLVWSVPAPEMDPQDARLELARRHLHIFGPTDPGSFSSWAGVKLPRARATYDELRAELVAVDTPIGERWILATDEPSFTEPDRPEGVRILPSGDSYWLLQGDDRTLLVADEVRMGELWTPRVWPGAIVIDGEIVGVWRRAAHKMTVQTWRPLSTAEHEGVEAEAVGLPLPNLTRDVEVRWE